MFSHKSYILTIALLIYLCSLISVQSQTLTGPSGETILTYGGRYSAAVSLDESMAATSGDYGVFLWDTFTGEQIRHFYKEDQTIMGVAFSPDGSKLLVSGNYSVLWDIESGQELLSFDCSLNSSDGLSISPDGKYTLICRYVSSTELFTAEQWNLETGAFVRSFGDYIGTTTNAVFSPDMKYIAIGTEISKADLWSVEDGEKLITYIHDMSVDYVEFSPDGNHLLTVTGNGYGRLWDTFTGDLIHLWSKPGSYRYSTDGRRIELSARRNVDTGEPAYFESIDPETGETIESKTIPGMGINTHFFNDGRHMISGYWGFLQLWNLETNEPVLTYGNSINSIYNAEFSPDGKTISVGSDFSAYLIDTENGAVVRTFSPLNESAYYTSLSADGRFLITNGNPTTIRLWDVETSDLLLSQDVIQTRQDISACVTHDGTKLLTGAGTDENELGVIWDVAAGEKIHSFLAPAEGGGGNSPMNVSITDSSLSKTRPLSSYTPTLSRVATFSPDESKALTLDKSRMSAILWDVETGEVIHTFTGHSQEILCAEFSKDGQYVVTGGNDHIVQIWDVETGDNLNQIPVALIRDQYKYSTVNHVSLSPDNRFLLAATKDYYGRGNNPIALLDTFSGEKLFSFNGNHGEQIVAAEFSPDGDTILTASSDGTIRIWRFADLIQTSFADGFELYP